MQIAEKKGFTLIELLVVIGVIAVIAGVGFSIFGGRNSGTNLANAQFISVSLLNSARAQAAATGRNARILVAADTSTTARDDFLRRFYVAFQDVDQITGNSTWKVTDSGTALPPSVYVVPENLDSTYMAAGVSVFGTNFRSNFSGTAPISLTFPGVPSSSFWYIELTPRGTIVSGPDRLVMATAQTAPPGSTPPGPRFDNDQNMRGFRLSTYGVPTFANDASSFQ
jgi:prepilin-type N-terminal cleavage/methylation domain-containing protein